MNNKDETSSKISSISVDVDSIVIQRTKGTLYWEQILGLENTVRRRLDPFPRILYDKLRDELSFWEE